MTEEQNAAFIKLRSLAAPFRFRVVADGEGWPIIPGEVGRIEYYDGSALALYTDRPRLFAKAWSITGARRHQTGDSEIRVLAPLAALAEAAGVIGARRQRAPGTAKHLARHAYKVTSGPRDAPEGVSGGRNTTRVAGRARRPPKSLCTPAGAGA